MNPAEAYILRQSQPYRSMLLHLSILINRTGPNVVLKYKWNIPCFYVDYKPFCYLNVSEKKGYVDIAFWNAASLTKHLDKMCSDNRKVIKSLRYFTLEEINDTVVKEVLLDAYTNRFKNFYG